MLQRTQELGCKKKKNNPKNPLNTLDKNQNTSLKTNRKKMNPPKPPVFKNKKLPKGNSSKKKLTLMVSNGLLMKKQ